jgi:hypothetical protein
MLSMIREDRGNEPYTHNLISTNLIIICPNEASDRMHHLELSPMILTNLILSEHAQSFLN